MEVTERQLNKTRTWANNPHCKNHEALCNAIPVFSVCHVVVGPGGAEETANLYEEGDEIHVEEV